MASSLHHHHQQHHLIPLLFLFLFFLFFFSTTTSKTTPSSSSSASSSSSCRCLPCNEDCWPSEKSWANLNKSINGNLIASKPPASPCHDPYYDTSACTSVTQQWSDPFWRAAQPGASQDSFFEMDGDKQCLLTANRSTVCEQGRVPVYTVSVTHPSHVEDSVRFATRHNLRLVIKNSGHDYLGRNNAPGSLSLWMHNLKNITFVDSFLPQGCHVNNSDSNSNSDHDCHSKSQSAVTVGAGVLWEELYKAVEEKGKTIAGAQCSSVGTSGGFVQAAGHSPLSPTYGLSADNVLEYHVVTADGRLRVANEFQNKDLFWALRGGGGGTFGVVVSVTHSTFPKLQSLAFASYFIVANTSSAFETLLTEFTKHTPDLSAAGWGGYSALIFDKTFVIGYLLPDRNLTYAQSTFDPLLSTLHNISDLQITGEMKNFTSYYEWHKATQCSPEGCSFPTGGSEILTSRLIPRKTFSDSPLSLAQTLVKIKSQGYDRVMLFATAGGKVSTLQNNSVNPAWRDALWHVIVVKQFHSNETVAVKQSLASAITKAGQLLRDITPGSGSYMNEADYNEPNWQQSFFGDHYAKLRSIKNKLDPHGLFVCRYCVGSEDWSDNLNCPLHHI